MGTGRIPWEVEEPPEPESLKGKPLPSLEAVALQNLDAIEGNMILLCFFDLEQRPSRHFVKTLAGRTKPLAKLGVVVLGVESSGMARPEALNWMKENGLSFPIGRIEKEREKILASFGVESLPWLLLTDRGHVVRFENIEFDEIEEKVKELEKK